jgi:hypothetical protein
MDMNVGNPDEVSGRDKRHDKKPSPQTIPHHPFRHNEAGIKYIIRDIRIHFLRYESPYYGTELDQNTGKCYVLEAKRKFTKYYLEHIAEFYHMFWIMNGGKKC